MNHLFHGNRKCRTAIRRFCKCFKCDAADIQSLRFPDLGRPFCRLELVAEILTTSALNLNAASSNEVRVRVLGSTKKLTSVLPRKAGTFLMSRAPTVLKAPAESSMVLISEGASSRILRRSLRIQFSPASNVGSAVFMVFRRGRNRLRDRLLLSAL